MVERLVQQGLLIREKDSCDRRITIFRLTDEAQALLKEQKSSINEIFRKVLEPLTPAEQTELVEAFETIFNIVRKREK